MVSIKILTVKQQEAHPFSHVKFSSLDFCNSFIRYSFSGMKIDDNDIFAEDEPRNKGQTVFEVISTETVREGRTSYVVSLHLNNYRNNPKNLDTQKIAVIILKYEQNRLTTYELAQKM